MQSSQRRGTILLSRDIQPCLQTRSVVTTWGLLLASRGQSPGMLSSILQSTGQSPPRRITGPQHSIVCPRETPVDHSRPPSPGVWNLLSLTCIILGKLLPYSVSRFPPRMELLNNMNSTCLTEHASRVQAWAWPAVAS